MLHKIRKVKYLEGYELELHFDDRSVRAVDLEQMLKKAKNKLLPLKNIDYFKQVRCDGITINWPNGVDLCPDVLYSMGEAERKPKSFRIHKKQRKVVKV